MQETPSQAYISKVHLKGYKSIRDLEIDFKPGLNIIIGPNGSGKTNFLEFLDLTTNKFEFIDIDDINEFEIDKNFVVDGEYIQQSIKGRFANSKKTKAYFETTEKIFKSDLKFELNIEFGQNLPFRNLVVGKSEIEKFEHLPHLTYLKYGNEFDSIIEGNITCNVKILNKGDNSKILGLNQFSRDICLPLFRDKFNTNDILDSFKLIDKRFNELLNLYSPIREVSFDTSKYIKYPDKNDDTIENILLKFHVSNKKYKWEHLSDGTRRIFYLIFAIHFYPAKIILLEEPELGIHPDQLYKLMDFLKEQSKEKQIIITTHSPEVLNILKQDEVDRIIVTRYEGEKGTKMYHLSEKEQSHVRNYMKHEASISDYWLQSGFEKENEEEVAS